MDYDVELWEEFQEWCEDNGQDPFLTDYSEWLADRADGYRSEQWERG